MELTIAIPTYNRAAFLEILLESIDSQIVDKNYPVEVEIYDNDSKDQTKAIVARYTEKDRRFKYKKNSNNIGPDRNIEKAFSESNGRYVWIVGDDDILLPNSIYSALRIIRDANPSLISFNCQAFAGNFDYRKTTSKTVCYTQCNSTQILKKANINLTFISAVIINKDALIKANLANGLDNLFDTNLVQLGWVLPAMQLELPSVYVSTKLVAGRNENRSGYGEFNVFTNNFNKIISTYFHAFPVWKKVLKNISIRERYTASLMFMQTGWGNFEQEGYREILVNTCGKNIRYWIFLYPLLSLSGKWKKGYFFAIRMVNFALRMPINLQIELRSKKFRTE